jgi:nucleotide-binding universal stress UspA family protein
MVRVKEGRAVYQHILCPTDFSEACRAALDQAMRLAASLEARLTVLHVIHDPALDEEEEDEEMRAFYAELQARAEERMAELVPPGARGGIDCRIQRGEPIREILREVMTEGVDLVLLGSHGKSGVEAKPFGTTARALVVLSPAPVLVVKPEGYDPRKAAEGWEES